MTSINVQFAPQHYARFAPPLHFLHCLCATTLTSAGYDLHWDLVGQLTHRLTAPASMKVRWHCIGLSGIVIVGPRALIVFLCNLHYSMKNTIIIIMV